MISYKLLKSEYDVEYKIELDRIKGFIEFRKEEYKKHNITPPNKMGFNVLMRGIVSSMSTSLLALLSNLKTIEKIKEENKDKNNELNGFYFQMITSHMMIISDFEFFNIALITKYFLEVAL